MLSSSKLKVLAQSICQMDSKLKSKPLILFLLRPLPAISVTRFTLTWARSCWLSKVRNKVERITHYSTILIILTIETSRYNLGIVHRHNFPRTKAIKDFILAKRRSSGALFIRCTSHFCLVFPS